MALAFEPTRLARWLTPAWRHPGLLEARRTGSPSYAALLTMAVYTFLFGFIANRYFRWE